MAPGKPNNCVCGGGDFEVAGRHQRQTCVSSSKGTLGPTQRLGPARPSPRRTPPHRSLAATKTLQRFILHHLIPLPIGLQRQASAREPHRERCDNLFPRCALIGAMHETSNADWWDARITWQLTPLSLRGSLLSTSQCIMKITITADI